MKKILIATIAILSLTNAAEKPDAELVMRDHMIFKKFSNTPYTGKGMLEYKIEKIIARVEAKKGLFHGTTEIYDIKTGNLKRIMTFKDNHQEGIDIQYTDKGEKISEVIYHNNKPCDGWSKNRYGKLEYKNCKKSGTEWKYKKGKSYIVTWKDGKIIKEESVK